MNFVRWITNCAFSLCQRLPSSFQGIQNKLRQLNGFLVVKRAAYCQNALHILLFVVYELSSSCWMMPGPSQIASNELRRWSQSPCLFLSFYCSLVSPGSGRMEETHINKLYTNTVYHTQVNTNGHTNTRGRKMVDTPNVHRRKEATQHRYDVCRYRYIRTHRHSETSLSDSLTHNEKLRATSTHNTHTHTHIYREVHEMSYHFIIPLKL